MKEVSGLSGTQSSPEKKVCGALWEIRFLLTQQTPLLGEKLKEWYNKQAATTHWLKCHAASLKIKGVILLMNQIRLN